MAIGTSLAAVTQEHAQMPPGMTHGQHLALLRKAAETKTRGAAAMGFDQDATTHRFVLAADGGAIEVEVKNPEDVANRNAIREHLRQIAAEFARGVFEKPFATHGEVPPGVPMLQRLQGSVAYTYEQTSLGARVHIRTSNGEALAAVHDFLRYQIKEHHPGDPTSIRK